VKTPLEFVSVISESALARCAAQESIAEEQLAHLVNIAKRSNVSLQVLPFGAGLHNSMTGAFALLDFPSDTWPPAVYQEHAVGGHLGHDRELVSGLSAVFEDLRGRALTESASLNLIKKYARR
jgi:Domain of unknown function (DUF5753)